MKHAASLEVEGALFHVDCGTELIGHVLRGALLALHGVTSGLAVFVSPFPKKKNQPNKQIKPTLGIWIMVCRPLINRRTSSGLVRHLSKDIFSADEIAKCGMARLSTRPTVLWRV